VKSCFPKHSSIQRGQSRNDCFRSTCSTKSLSYQKLIQRHAWEKYVEEADHLRHKQVIKKIYAKRKETIERVFADAKENGQLDLGEPGNSLRRA
jgi:hypothetical protein